MKTAFFFGHESVFCRRCLVVGTRRGIARAALKIHRTACDTRAPRGKHGPRGKYTCDTSVMCLFFLFVTMIGHIPFLHTKPLRCRPENFIHNFFEIFFVNFFIRQIWLYIIIIAV